METKQNTIRIEAHKTEVIHTILVNGVPVAESKTVFTAEAYAEIIEKAFRAANVEFVREAAK